jgi:hypothetical protein
MSDTHKPRIPCHNTGHGFRFGAAEVRRSYSMDDGRVVVSVTPDQGQPLDIYISPTGRSVRVFRKGVELKESQG